jgi:hypothetical protein
MNICRRNGYHSSKDGSREVRVKMTVWNYTLPNMAGNGHKSVGQPCEDSRNSISKEDQILWKGGVSGVNM